ncbi:uncharacterized protein LOC111710663 [Eurytemora carolleeae]|uniref:uncharacterized protein LOC111710663 n=1 Tax=Eurytemora carolleeae TaxID=1294199 RepID=UPI000C777A87|nr:uncharacterized protein LOC111710663 [Eurytemora carolleeae]|eukprot:XP_023340554.1 uncharacterized protein LOC111710663 [Eurytemora affinis]
MNTLLWTLVGSALCIVYTEGACEDECKLKDGMCSWSQPGLDYQAIGNCSEGVLGVGTYCECGTCWKPVSADVPCCKKCEGEGGVCSEKQPSPEYQMNEYQCIGTFQGAPTYCGYCWKVPELGLPCTKFVCAEGKGVCSTERPGGFIPWTGTGPEPPPAPEYTEYGFCDTFTKDCICWVHYTFYE